MSGFLVNVGQKQGLEKRAREVAAWEKSGEVVRSCCRGAAAALRFGQLGIPRRQGREMGGGAAGLGWGPRAPGLGGWMPRRVEWGGGEPAVDHCLPGPVSGGSEEQLWELGLWVEGAGAADRGSVPFPGSSLVGFGSQTHECASLRECSQGRGPKVSVGSLVYRHYGEGSQGPEIQEGGPLTITSVILSCAP